MRFGRISANKLEDKHLQQISNLEVVHSLYRLDNEEIFTKNKKSFIVVRDIANDKVVGFLKIIPINKDGTKRLLNRPYYKLTEKDIISNAELNSTKKKTYINVYFDNIIIDEGYRDKNIIFFLLNYCLKDIYELAKNKIYIKYVYARTRNTEGKKLIQIFKSKNVNTNLYRFNFLKKYDCLLKYGECGKNVCSEYEKR